MAQYIFEANFGTQNWGLGPAWDVFFSTPGAADTVFISNGFTVGTSCIVNSSQAANSVSIQNGNVLDVQTGGTLAVGGLMSVGSNSGVSQLNVSGAVSAATLFMGEGSGGQALVTVSGGTLTISGNISAGVFAASTLQVSNGGAASCKFLFVGNSANSVDGRLVIGGSEFGAAATAGTVSATSGITLETSRIEADFQHEQCHRFRFKNFRHRLG